VENRLSVSCSRSSTGHALESLDGLIARLVLGEPLVELAERALPVAVEVEGRAVPGRARGGLLAKGATVTGVWLAPVASV
jgi:hypothetical protein